MLCSGRAKLSTTSRDGKVLILKIADAGEVLGLSAVIAGEPFELTAETAGPCQVNFIEREVLLSLMQKNGEIGLHASQAVSKEFQSAYRDIHDLVLARSSAGKLAKLLLSWTPERQPFEATEIRVRASLSSRRNGANDWLVAGNRYPAAERSEEEKPDPFGWLHAGNPKSNSVGSACCIAKNAAQVDGKVSSPTVYLAPVFANLD